MYVYSEIGWDILTFYVSHLSNFISESCLGSVFSTMPTFFYIISIKLVHERNLKGEWFQQYLLPYSPQSSAFIVKIFFPEKSCYHQTFSHGQLRNFMNED